VARRLRRLALLESMCQRRSEDFVPPAAQRKAVGPTKAQRIVTSGERGGKKTAHGTP